MHRHGYKGRKFGRSRDQRRALMKGLADTLIIHESIETTIDKAKELVPYTEKLITKAKKGSLHNRRQIIARLHTREASHKLVDDIAPKLSRRTSGHLRIERTKLRRGDNAQLARVSFVDDLKQLKKPVPTAAMTSAKPKSEVKKTAPAAKNTTASAKEATTQKAGAKK